MIDSGYYIHIYDIIYIHDRQISLSTVSSHGSSPFLKQQSPWRFQSTGMIPIKQIIIDPCADELVEPK